jgi:hypothetical protein
MQRQGELRQQGVMASQRLRGKGCGAFLRPDRVPVGIGSSNIGSIGVGNGLKLVKLNRLMSESILDK